MNRNYICENMLNQISKKILQIRNYNSLEKIKKLEKIKRHIDENN